MLVASWWDVHRITLHCIHRIFVVKDKFSKRIEVKISFRSWNSITRWSIHQPRMDWRFSKHTLPNFFHLPRHTTNWSHVLVISWMPERKLYKIHIPFHYLFAHKKKMCINRYLLKEEVKLRRKRKSWNRF